MRILFCVRQPVSLTSVHLSGHWTQHGAPKTHEPKKLPQLNTKYRCLTVGILRCSRHVYALLALLLLLLGMGRMSIQFNNDIC